jgi:hypothetical protein
MTLEEEIAALNNEIARWNTEYDAAKANGNEARQDLLLATITVCRSNLDKLLDRQREERRLDQQIHHSQPHAQLAPAPSPIPQSKFRFNNRLFISLDVAPSQSFSSTSVSGKE